MIMFYISIVFCFLPVAYMVFSRKKRDKKYRKTLRKDIERLPGTSLQRKIENQDMDILFNVFATPFLFSIILMGFNKTNQYVYVFLGIIASFFIVNSIRIIRKRDNFLFGFECEVVVGQDLKELEKWGYYVLHDFQGRNYNIDHIIIGPSGLYVVETKGRRKLRKKDNSHKVYYNGERLRFPTHEETKPIEQVKAHANSLGKWVFENTGKKYNVQCIMAFPGWHYYIEKQIPSTAPMIFSGRNTTWIRERKTILNEQQIWELYRFIRKRCLINIEEEKITIP